MFPPGLAKLSTSPEQLGRPVVTTIGNVFVACLNRLGANVGCNNYDVDLEVNQFIASPGSRSSFPSA